MKTGLKSVLFGGHCFFIHPFFVALAWKKLYGKPKDFRLWFAFFVHDLGYWNKVNIDDDEGERHVELGAKIMGRLFDKPSPKAGMLGYHWLKCNVWHNFSLYHSRFYARKDNRPFSRLCVADKLAITLEPKWLYLLRVMASGEIKEYMALAKNGKYLDQGIGVNSIDTWYENMTGFMRRWVEENKDCAEDEAPC